MSYYEELLTLGQHLHEEERAALYKFLRTKEDLRYSKFAEQLSHFGMLSEQVADGELIFTLKDDFLNYSARKMGTEHLYENLRTAKLGILPFLKQRRIKDFIAQAEVEAIWNFPLPGANEQMSSGYTVISYPFYDLRYFSQGKSRLLGLMKKLVTDDSEIMSKLTAS
jgi:hypothetical protein